MGGAGVLTFFSSMRLAWVHGPDWQDAVLTTSNTFFDASAAVPLLLFALYVAGGVSRVALFGGYACVAAVLYSSVSLLWRRHLADASPSSSAVATKDVEVTEVSRSAEDEVADDDALGPREMSIREMARTLHYWTIVVWLSLHLLRSNLYLGTVKEQLQQLGGGTTYLSIFIAMLPLGVLCIPVVSRILGRLGSVLAMQVVTVVSLLFGCLSLVPNLRTQLATFAVYAGRGVHATRLCPARAPVFSRSSIERRSTASSPRTTPRPSASRTWDGCDRRARGNHHRIALASSP